MQAMKMEITPPKQAHKVTSETVDSLNQRIFSLIYLEPENTDNSTRL